MVDVRIERIKIRNFRGIAEIDIPLTKQNLLFYGENGSGKSSFIDAIEYLLTGRIERFERRDVKNDQSIPFLKRDELDTTIRLECFCSGKPSVPVEINYPATTYIADSMLDTWMTQLIAYPPILRRKHIVAFIQEKGSDRLKRLSQIIGLEQVDKTKTIWEAEKRKRKGALKNAQATLKRQEERFKQLTSELQGQSDFERISSRLSSVELPPVINIKDIQQRKEELSLQVSSSEIGQRLQAVKEIKNIITSLHNELTLLQGHIKDFYPQWKEYSQQKENLQGELLRQFLTKGKEILSVGEGNKICPFCEQIIVDDNIEVRIQSRLDKLEKVHLLSEEIDSLRRKIHSQISNCIRLIRQFNDLGSVLDVHKELLITLKESLTNLHNHAEESIITVNYPSVDSFSSILSDGLQVIEELQNIFDTQFKDIQENLGNTDIADTLAWLGQIEECLRNIENTKREHQLADIRFQHIERMVNALIKAREQHLTAINAEIANDFNRFYQKMHPQEGYGGIQLIFESAGKGIGLTADYHGTSSHPLGFYSEGHLDTLGIAVFLAYIRRFSEAKLLILDDVMTTMDGAHRLRLAHLLDEEFSDYQIILTTHDRLWAEGLQKALTQLQSVHLTWSISDGVTTHELLEENWDAYISLATTNPHDAVLKCARDFEKFLNIMRFNFALAVPARYGDRYTLGEMNDVFFNWIKKKKIQHPDTDYEVKWQNLQSLLKTHLVLRNVAGAHYNEWASNLSSQEAQDFVNLVKDLTDLFKCPSCQKHWVQYNMATKIIYCKYCSDREKTSAPQWQTNGK